MTDLDPKGLAAARAYAQWHIGYPSWADSILHAYFNPDEARRQLALEKGETA